MNREYIEYYLSSRKIKMYVNLQDLFIIAAADPEGEQAGYDKLAGSLGVPTRFPGTCITCGDCIAEYGIKKGFPKWCQTHKPEDANHKSPVYQRRDFRENCISNARFLSYE
jgi:hypothetical protein